MMNESNIRQLVERFLNAETTLEEEQTLYAYIQGEDVADGLKPYREAFLGFAAVSGIDKPVVHTPAWVIALRTALSMAAVFLVGLFFFVNEDTPVAPQLTNVTKQTDPTPTLCEGSTLQDLYMCYLERKRERPNTYTLLKQMIYENEH